MTSVLPFERRVLVLSDADNTSANKRLSMMVIAGETTVCQCKRKLASHLTHNRNKPTNPDEIEIVWSLKDDEEKVFDHMPGATWEVEYRLLGEHHTGAVIGATQEGTADEDRRQDADHFIEILGSIRALNSQILSKVTELEAALLHPARKRSRV